MADLNYNNGPAKAGFNRFLVQWVIGMCGAAQAIKTEPARP